MAVRTYTLLQGFMASGSATTIPGHTIFRLTSNQMRGTEEPVDNKRLERPGGQVRHRSVTRIVAGRSAAGCLTGRAR